MNAKDLPARPSLSQYKKQAKDLVKAHKSGDPNAMERIGKSHPQLRELAASRLPGARFRLADAQLVIAREHNFESWPKFAKQIEELTRENPVALLSDPLTAFIDAATWHGTLKEAEPILAAHPEMVSRSVHVAAILGDDAAVRRHLAADAGCAAAKVGPWAAEPLVYLCLSKYLRLDKARSDAFLRAATALIDAGADPNAGFWTKGEYPEFETPLYGAAGVAHHAGMTRLLLDRGANPNDDETVYHSPETDDNDAMKLLVETGRLTADNLAMMLARKHDWHDHDGVQYLLAQGVDPNHKTRWGFRALHHAIARDNDLRSIDLLLDHGADPALTHNGRSATVLAARRGRGDVLASLVRRGIPLELPGVERLIAACATGDAAEVHSIAGREPHLVREIMDQGGKLLAEFAGTANLEGVGYLLDLGVDIRTLYEGDGYFDIARDSTALHVAAWRARPKVVKLLIERGALVNALDAKGRSPLTLAVKACVDSYWKHRRSPESVELLLAAGAALNMADFPCGYAEVDELIRRWPAGKKPES